MSKKNILLVSISVLTILGVIFGIVNLFSNSRSISTISNSPAEQDTSNEDAPTKYNSMIKIENMDNISKNSDPVIKRNAQIVLYRYATKMKSDKQSYIGNIRDNSFSQTLDNDGFYTDSMIVDIPELKQSWGLRYIWSKTKTVTGDHIFPLCLNENQLIYDKFDCESNFGKYENN